MSKAVLVGFAIAAAAACGDNRAENSAGHADANGTTATDRTDASAPSAQDNRNQTPITVAGCLQKGDSGEFILTRINEPTQSVGTTGSANSRTAEREQMRSAAGAFRVEPSGDVKVDQLVGKQVRVTGTVAEDATLPPSSGSAASDRRDNQSGGSATGSGNTSNSANTSNSGNDRNDRAEIRQGDLTKIDATAVETIADTCRGAETPAAGATTGGTGSNSRR
jgi:hypothetical protein